MIRAMDLVFVHAPVIGLQKYHAFDGNCSASKIRICSRYPSYGCHRNGMYKGDVRHMSRIRSIDSTSTSTFMAGQSRVNGFLFSIALWTLVLLHSFGVTKSVVQNAQQKTFNLPPKYREESDSPSSRHRHPGYEVAAEAFKAASPQVQEMFEAFISGLDDDFEHLTLSPPQKNVTLRPAWDFTVSTTALPEHSLRVKRPNSLGVDDTKQV